MSKDAKGTTCLLAFLVRSTKMCCAYALLRRYRAMQSGRLARYLGVSRRTVQYWRKRFKQKCLTCEHRSNCMKDHLFTDFDVF